MPSNLSPHWAWTAGTPWRIVSPEAFGTTSPNVSRGLGGVGLASKVTETFSLGVNYDMQASPSGYLNQIGSVRLKVRL